MTIFPCSRCGQVPEVEEGRMSATIQHKCPRGRPYKTEFVGPYQQENIEGAIYLWNEKNASDNPAWWPERYDYLRTLCNSAREAETCDT